MPEKNITRKKAREIALSCIFESGFGACDPEEILESRTGGNLASLWGEGGPFDGVLQERDEAYVRAVTSLCVQHREELEEEIAKYSVGWEKRRISRMTMAILLLAFTEILYMDDIPEATSADEAVELAKKYDTEKAPAFINGILGTFLKRGEV